MSEKKDPEILREERRQLRVRKSQQWVHKKSGRVCEVVDTVVDCESNEWMVVYTFILKNRFEDDMYFNEDWAYGINFVRNYNTFMEKFDPIVADKVKVTRAELDMLRSSKLMKTGQN